MSKRVSNKKGEHQGARCVQQSRKRVSVAPRVPIADFVIERPSLWRRTVKKVCDFVHRRQSR